MFGVCRGLDLCLVDMEVRGSVLYLDIDCPRALPPVNRRSSSKLAHGIEALELNEFFTSRRLHSRLLLSFPLVFVSIEDIGCTRGSHWQLHEWAVPACQVSSDPAPVFH